MKKLALMLSILMIGTAGLFASNAGYYLDNQKVDDLFNNAVEVSLIEMTSTSMNGLEGMTSNNLSFNSEESTALIAWILCWVVGAFGIHRHYLGTKSSMWAIYTFTCFGIFGIVPFVDFWVLLIDGVVNENIVKYQDNENFFMWGG
ncbi:MAG: NINE protein [Bacteroidales bacterium]